MIDGRAILPIRYSSSSRTVNICGSTLYNDIGENRIAFIYPHTATSINIKFRSSINYPTTRQSFGISRLSILCIASTTLAQNFYYSGPVTASSGKAFALYPNILSTAACHTSCLECYGALDTQCLSCKPTYIFDGTFCVAPACLPGYYQAWNNTCTPTCPSPLITGYVSGILKCDFQCSTNQYLYWDGTCQTSCPHPLTTYEFLNVSLCQYTCGTGQYLYSNMSCISTCPLPYFSSQINSKALCNACPSPEFMALNGSCVSFCDPGYGLILIDGLNVCDKICGAQYVNYNDTCVMSCDAPYLVQNLSGIMHCNFPCDPNLGFYLYPDNVCRTCVFPNIKKSENGGHYCDFLCNATTGLYYLANYSSIGITMIGSCVSACPASMKISLINEGSYCVPLCNNTIGEFFYPNGSCLASCDYPWLQNLNYGVLYCEFPCIVETNHLYWNGSCIADCLLPYISQNTFGKYLCLFPCNLGQFLYENGTCSDFCPYPLNSSFDGTYYYCYNPCSLSPGTFLYYNQSCITGCNLPFIIGSLTNNYCDFPCNQSNYEFAYYNASCSIQCDVDLIPRITPVGNFCDFQCNFMSEYLYWNMSCLPSCPLPYTMRTIGDLKYCDFMCDSALGDYLYPNGSCIKACNPPLYIPLLLSNENYCLFSCGTSYYYVFNQSCNPTCSPPYIPQNVSNENYCYFPCIPGEYLYPNGSCINNCLPPKFTIQSLINESYCSFTCGSNFYYTFNQTCNTLCPAPYISRNFSTEYYCDLPCNVGEYLYDNGSCLASCNSPDFEIQSELYFDRCKFICNNQTEYYYANATCMNRCVLPYSIRNEFGNVYCDINCDFKSGQFVLNTGNCNSSCNFPYFISNRSDLIYCDPPCDFTLEYFSLKYGCIASCESPYQVSYANDSRFCIDPCGIDSTLATQEACVGNVLSSIESLSNPTIFQISKICDLTSQFMDKTSFIDNCHSNSAYSEKIVNYTMQILVKISTLMQNISSLNSNMTYISTKNFDIYGTKQTECAFINNSLETTSAAPQINFTTKGSSCSNSEVLVTYFVLNNSLFCDQANAQAKTKIFLDVKDANTGASILNTLAAVIKMPAGIACPPGCGYSALKICVCENLNIFDVKNQILSLFANSNIGKLTDFSALIHWLFYQDLVFWIVASLYIWFAITLVLVRKYFKRVCRLRQYLENEHKNTSLGFRTLFKISHPLICIYLLDSPLYSKPTQATLYLLRILSIMTFSSIFKTDANSTVGQIINPYLVLLPYITIIPLICFLQFLVSNDIKSNSFEYQNSETERKTNNLKKKLGFISIAAIVSGFTLFIFVIAAQQETDEKFLWMIQFFKVLIQDLIITPLLYLIQQALIFNMLKARREQETRRCKKILLKLFDQTSYEIFRHQLRGKRFSSTRRFNRPKSRKSSNFEG